MRRESLRLAETHRPIETALGNTARLWHEAAERPVFAAALSEAVLWGGRALRAAFLDAPLRTAAREAKLAGGHECAPAAILLRKGFAFRSCGLADGTRSILDILTPMDMVGLADVVLANPTEEIVAASPVSYHALPDSRIAELIDRDRNVAWYAMAQLAEARWRAHRLAASIGRRDARGRLCMLFRDIHDRLRRHELISRGTFNLPLTQEQIADHLGLTVVHVNRTLKRLREERIVAIDRQVVIIIDDERLRMIAGGSPGPAQLPEGFNPGNRRI